MFIRATLPTYKFLSTFSSGLAFAFAGAGDFGILRRLVVYFSGPFGFKSLERLDPAVLGTPDIRPSLLEPLFVFFLLVFDLLVGLLKLVEASRLVAFSFSAL